VYVDDVGVRNEHIADEEFLFGRQPKIRVEGSFDITISPLGRRVHCRP
jgi:hypothetical protein